jgi:hypothetical protein
MNTTEHMELHPGLLEPLSRLTRDEANAAITLTPHEARFLVDTFYQMQQNRIRTQGRIRSMARSDEPHDTLLWLKAQDELLEKQIGRALDKYSASMALGQWARSIVGIGPIIAAGLIAHIDIAKCETAGAIWKFAGLAPDVKWGKGEKRPWNASLKTLCWKIGTSFVKTQNVEGSQYGPVYAARKALEVERNDRGDFSAQAAQVLMDKRIGKNTDAYRYYSGEQSLIDAEQIAVSAFAHSQEATPSKDEIERFREKLRERLGESKVFKLPPAHIDARARRYAVKLFLAHYFEAGYFMLHGTKAPKPYALTHMEHVHYIEPPNTHLIPGW